MAYQNKVTGRRIYGSVIPAPPIPVVDSGLGQLTEGLSKLNKMVGIAGEQYIKGKQSKTAAELEKLRSEGKSSKEIEELVVNGENPVLSKAYNNVVINGYLGGFGAMDAINKITRSLSEGNYDPKKESFQEFYSSQMPNLEGASKEYIQAFHAKFQPAMGKLILQDNEARGAAALQQKTEQIQKQVDMEHDLTSLKNGGFWKTTGIYTKEILAGVNGKKDSYINNVQANLMGMDYARGQYLENTFESLDKAEAVLLSDRGFAKDGKTALGSLATTGIHENDAKELLKQIRQARDTLERQDEANEKELENKRLDEGILKMYNIDQKIESLTGATSTEDQKTLKEERQKKFELGKAMEQIEPKFFQYYQQFSQNKDVTNQDVDKVEEFFNDVAENVYADNHGAFIRDGHMLNLTDAQFAKVAQSKRLARQNRMKGIQWSLNDPMFKSDLNATLKGVEEKVINKYADLAGFNAVIRNKVSKEMSKQFNYWLQDNLPPLTTDPNFADLQATHDVKKSEFIKKLSNEMLAAYKKDEFLEAQSVLFEAATTPEITQDTRQLADDITGSIGKNILREFDNVAREFVEQQFETGLKNPSKTLRELRSDLTDPQSELSFDIFKNALQTEDRFKNETDESVLKALLVLMGIDPNMQFKRFIEISDSIQRADIDGLALQGGEEELTVENLNKITGEQFSPDILKTIIQDDVSGNILRELKNYFGYQTEQELIGDIQKLFEED